MANQFQFIEDAEHHEVLINLFKKAKRTLWIGTADIKDLYIKQGIQTVPMLKLLEDIIKQGVEVRLIHAKEPGPNFRADFDKYPLLRTQLERVLCPRVHFKLYIIDLTEAYIGSANFTGAAIGMKSKNNRNFEAGILTSNPEIVKQAVNQFDKVWIGKHCATCTQNRIVVTKLMCKNYFNGLLSNKQPTKAELGIFKLYRLHNQYSPISTLPAALACGWQGQVRLIVLYIYRHRHKQL